MITDNNKKLAQWAMDFALKNGCQAAKVVLYANSNTSFELRDAKMDRLQQASERQIPPAIIQVANPICRCSMIRSLVSIRMIK